MTESLSNGRLRDQTTLSNVPCVHDHYVVVDSQGNGLAYANTGTGDEHHSHVVSNWAIQSAEGHTHRFITPVDLLKQKSTAPGTAFERMKK
jgi:hypothetical protein